MKSKSYQTVLKETKLAYADCNEKNMEKGMKLRNLNFKASASVTVNEAIEIMTKSLGAKKPTDEAYNEFSPALLNKLPEGSEVTLAREGSVCVYVKLPVGLGEGISDELSETMLADEYHTENGVARLWWD